MAKLIDITKLSDEELIHLNREICALLRARSQLENNAKLLSFDPGDQVSFENPNGGNRICGTIVRVNQKSVTIATERGQWRVAPCFVAKECGVSRSKVGKLVAIKQLEAP